jgi:hypothetical protein
MRYGQVLFLLTLVIFIFLLWKYYWKMQIMYNASSLSFYTPDDFPIREGTTQQYEEMERRGKKIAKSKRCVIAAMVRDVEENIPLIIKRIERVGGLFDDYRVLVVENDSKDNTRKELLAWRNENPRVVILGCGYNAGACNMNFPKTVGHDVNRSRIEKMTKLRNIYLDEIKKNYRDYDYVMIWDVDALGTVYLDGILHSLTELEDHPNISVMCAYGVYRWGNMNLYYDTYATVSPGEKFHIDMKTAHDIRHGLFEHQYSRGDELVDVESCFSGFSIYRTKYLLPHDVFYDLSPPDNLECEHTRLHRRMKGRKVINPSMINYILLNE